MKQLFKNPVSTFTILSVFVLGGITAHGQVKVGAKPASITSNAVLDVEGTSAQRTVILQNGNMGINQTAPTNKLHVKDATNPARLEGLQVSDNAGDKAVVVDANGVLKTGKSGSITSFIVSNTNSVEYTRNASGNSTGMIGETTLVQNIPGCTYDANTNILTVPPGTYTATFTMNGNVKNGTSMPAQPIHSYFFDFPGENGTIFRIHQNQPSGKIPEVASHGICISYIFKTTTNREITLALGWGQGGNMVSGNIVNVQAIQFNISRVSD